MDKAYFNQLEQNFIKAKKKNYKCMYCNKTNAINSHFAPKVNWLSQITQNSKLYHVERRHFCEESSSFFCFAEKGLNNMLCQYIFCSFHDYKLFENIDNGNPNYDSYQVRIRVFYRNICAVLRQSEINIEGLNMCTKSPIALPALNKENDIQKLLTPYKSILEQEINSNVNDGQFLFKLFTFERVDICASNIIYYEDNVPISINIFPYKKNTAVLIGYKNYIESDYISKFIDLWGKTEDFKKNLTYFMVISPENWAISKQLYDSITPQKRNDYLHYLQNPTQPYNENFNLFE